MKALIISPNEDVRRHVRVALSTVERRGSGAWEFIEATDGVQGIRRAWKERPDVVIADEIASRAGAFAVAKDLKGATVPFAGGVIIVLAREQDAWLAEWSGADAWINRPIDPFGLADIVTRLVGATQEVG